MRCIQRHKKIVGDSVMQAKAAALTLGGTINLDFNPCVHLAYTYILYIYIYIYSL